MPTLGRYLTRIFLVNFATVLFGFAALLQLFDLLKNADDVISEHGGQVSSLATYAMLRAPAIVSFVTPFAVLIGSLLSLARLAQHNEITAIKSTGVSLYRVLGSFVPVAIVVAALHFLLANTVVPKSEGRLAAWNAATEEKAASASEEDEIALWLREGNLFVRVGGVLDDGRHLIDVTLLRREASGQVRVRTTAAVARHDDGRWLLAGVRRLTLQPDGSSVAESFDELAWPNRIPPSRFAELASPPSQLSLRELWEFVSNPGLASHPLHVYWTWLHQRIAVPFTTFLMFLLAAPVARGSVRRGGIGSSLLAGLALGFLYFVADGLLLAMGESGTLPPLLAAWAPPLVFSSLGVALLLHHEGF